MIPRYGLIFDVDGVIADSEAVNVRATAQAFEAILGITQVQERDFEAGIGRGAEEYVKAGARAHGRELSPDEVRALVNARQENFLYLLKNEGLPPFPGVLNLITNTLSDPSFRLAIATSSTRRKSQAVLDAAHIPYHDMVYVCADHIRHKKPHPEVFTVACERLALVPGSCVVIEDAPNGVQAAHAAGCQCIAVTNTCIKDKLKEADLVVDTLISVSVDTLLSVLGTL
jgi:HAD superfamily hydrolase (TIGR01509 family)